MGQRSFGLLKIIYIYNNFINFINSLITKNLNRYRTFQPYSKNLDHSICCMYLIIKNSFMIHFLPFFECKLPPCTPSWRIQWVDHSYLRQGISGLLKCFKENDFCNDLKIPNYDVRKDNASSVSSLNRWLVTLEERN